MAPFRFNFKGKVNTLAGHTKNLKAARNSAKARVEAARKIQAAYRAALERRRKRAATAATAAKRRNNITLANRLRSIEAEKAAAAKKRKNNTTNLTQNNWWRSPTHNPDRLNLSSGKLKKYAKIFGIDLRTIRGRSDDEIRKLIINTKKRSNANFKRSMKELWRERNARAAAGNFNSPSRRRKRREEIYTAKLKKAVTNAMGIPTEVTENQYNNNGRWIGGISVWKTDTQLLQEIKKRAKQWGVSLTHVVNGKRVAKTNAQLFRNIKIKNKSEHENLSKRLANLQNKITTHDKYNSRFVKGLREDAWKYEKLKVSMWKDIRSYFAKRGIRYPGVEHLYKTFHGSHGVILTHNKPLDFFLHYYDSDRFG